jgi:hypothetical protein
VLRGLTLCLIAVLGLASFVYGFGVLMSHGWDGLEGERVSSETWTLLPPLSAGTGIDALDRGLDGNLTFYRYEVGGRAYLTPRWTLPAHSLPTAEVHFLSFAPQIAVPAPHFPWATLFAIPLLCCLLALLVTRSRQISQALRATAEARAQIAARKMIMR